VSLPDAWWTPGLIVLVAAWTAWITVHGIRFVSAVAAIRVARRRSRAFPAAVESALPCWGRLRAEGRRAPLVVSDSVTTAAVLGWGPPVIAVSPSAVQMLDAEELDRILIHEWAHVQRRDDLVNVLQIVIRTIAGWHPALWWLDRRLHVEREIACDEMTVAITGSPKSYAASLLKLATLRGRSRVMHASPAALGSSFLRTRIFRIVSSRTSIGPIWSRSVAAAIVVILGAMSKGIGALTLVATVFATPFAPPRMPGAQPNPLALAAVPASSPETAAQQPAGRPAAPLPAVPPSAPERSVPPPQPRTEPALPAMPETATAADPAAGAKVPADADHEIAAAPLPSAPLTTPGQTAVNAPASQSPWTAVAAGGTAVGRKSKDAGVATAGFFTRVARRVAGSF
jgi:beta-lactamase regulating signal transducer with metallopeptidase domain